MERKYSSKTLRQDPKLLRNDFPCIGKWDMPIIKKCKVNVDGTQLIGADKIRTHDTSTNILRAVHFFVEDKKLDRYYNHAEKYLQRLAQYPCVLTPDYSLYVDMPMALQIYNTFRNRWCGAFWQSWGLSVIPSISWSTEASFKFCFDGIESGSIVAISTLGGLKAPDKELFLAGYYEMKRRISPERVICFGKAFREMGNEVIFAKYPIIKTQEAK